MKKGIADVTMPRYIKQPMKIQYLFKCLARAGNTRIIVIESAAYFPICIADLSSPALYLMLFFRFGDWKTGRYFSR